MCDRGFAPRHRHHLGAAASLSTAPQHGCALRHDFLKEPSQAAQPIGSRADRIAQEPGRSGGCSARHTRRGGPPCGGPGPCRSMLPPVDEVAVMPRRRDSVDVMVEPHDLAGLLGAALTAAGVDPADFEVGAAADGGLCVMRRRWGSLEGSARELEATSEATFPPPPAEAMDDERVTAWVDAWAYGRCSSTSMRAGTPIRRWATSRSWSMAWGWTSTPRW